MKKNILFILKTILALIITGISIYCIYIVNHLGIFPFKYSIVFNVVIILLNIIGTLFLYIHKWWLKIITILFYIIIFFICFFGIRYGTKTNNFLNKSFDNYKTEITTYNVLVRAKSSVKEYEDLSNKSVVYYTFYNDTEKIINEINLSLENVDFRPHDDLYDTFVNFMCGQYDAIILSDGLLDILSEDYKNLDTRLRNLYTFEITSKVKIEGNNNTPNNDYTHTKIKKGNSLNVYVSGSDSRSKKIYNKTRSDVNMILSINPDTKTILLTSIPRDYYVQVHGQTGLKDKLTHSGIYGLDTSRKTVEDLFDIEIDYSIKIGFPAVVELVDLVNGIDIDSDLEFDSFHMPGWRVKKGINHMDGAKALAYARERYAYAGGDRHRILNQQQVLEATLTKLSKDKKLLLKYDSLLNSLSKLYITDIPREEIAKYVRMQLNDMTSWKFISQSVDGVGEMTHTYTAPKSNRYVILPNQETVEEARNKMKKILEA